MYNLPPPYSTPNNFSKTRKLYNKEIYNPNKIRNSNKSTIKKDFNLAHNQEIFNSKSGTTIEYSVESNKESKIDVKSDELCRNKSDNDDVLFEIFGLKIFFDDVLILCILLFLYQEGIQDEYLFIALILLLLS